MRVPRRGGLHPLLWDQTQGLSGSDAEVEHQPYSKREAAIEWWPHRELIEEAVEWVRDPKSRIKTNFAAIAERRAS